jgi:hypothetical protein
MMRILSALGRAAAPALLCILAFAASAAAEGPPIRIGFSMPLSGPLASTGKAVLVAYKMWEEDANDAGGVLGRKVELVYYDDQSNPSLVPGIYAKLLDVDKVDVVLGSYGTNLTAPALPAVVPKGKVFFGLFALGERRIPIPELLLDVSGGSGFRPGILTRIFRSRQRCRIDKCRDRFGRHGLRQEGGGWRAGERQGDGIQDRLRA